MGLFNGNQKEFTLDDLNSPVMNKVLEFNAKKAQLPQNFEANQAKVKELTANIAEIRKQYFETYNEDLLKDITPIEAELTALQNVVKVQGDLLTRGDKRKYALSEDEQSSLMAAFKPYRQNRDDLIQKLNDQLSEVEKTLDELSGEQDIVYEKWSKLLGPLMVASYVDNTMFAHSLNGQRGAARALNKLAELQSHKAFNIHPYQMLSGE